MSILSIHAILIVFVLSNMVSGCSFMLGQKQGHSFMESFDRAIIKGGAIFVLGSGMTMVAAMTGNLVLPFA